MHRVMKKNLQSSSGLLGSIVRFSLIVAIAAMTTVTAHASSSEPLQPGPDARDEEKEGNGSSSSNNKNSSSSSSHVPIFGFRSPSSFMFSSPFFEEMDDQHGDFRPLVPLGHYSSTSSMSAFLDEAAVAHRNFLSSFFGVQHDHDHPLLHHHHKDDVTGRTFLRQKNILETLSDGTPPHAFLRGRGMGSFFPMPLLSDDHEVMDDNEKFQVSFQLPDGIESKDVQVRVQDGGTRLVIQGRSSTVRDNQLESKSAGAPKLKAGDNRYSRSSTAIQFSQSYLMDPNVVQVDDFVATVHNGRLTVSASKAVSPPKDDKRLPHVTPQKQDHVVRVEELNDKQSKFAKFIRSSIPNLLPTVPTSEEKGDRKNGKENDAIAAAQARADKWKDFSQITL